MRSGMLAGLVLAACVPEPTLPDPGPSAPVVEVVPRQEVLTPLPMRVSLPARYGAERVVVLFHTWGARDWGMTELARDGQRWSGEVSCREVSTVTGDTHYFFLALDDKGQVVADSGSDWPYVATIVGALPNGPRGLPDAPPPRRCHDPADCPPDFPGCPAYTWLRPACLGDDDCEAGARCEWDGYCSAPRAAVAIEEQETFPAAMQRAARRYHIAGVSTSKRRW